MKFKAAPMVVLGVLLIFPQLAQPASVIFTNLNGVGRVRGINRTGTVVGHTVGGDDVAGFILQSGTLTKVLVPGSIQTLMYGIENSGRIVGAYYKGDHAGAHGFLYFHGDVTTIDFPGANGTIARGINDLQRVVGEFRDQSGFTHGFLYDQGKFTQINVPGAINTYPESINNPGAIVGHFTDSTGHQHGFLYDSKGSITTVDVPFAAVADTFLFGINSPGVIVGSYVDDAGTHGFVDVGGVFTSIDAPETAPGIGTFVYGISDSGQLTIFSTVAFLGQLGQ